MKKPQTSSQRGLTLRSYITITITGTVAVILVLCSIFFYQKTARILRTDQETQIQKQLGWINEKVMEQINLIDSLNAQFMSNTLIRDQVEPSTYESGRQLAVERQMSYLLINHPLWHEGLIQSVSLFLNPTRYCYVSVSGSPGSLRHLREVAHGFPKEDTGLAIRSLDGAPDSLFFVRNIYSTYTGQRIATAVFEISKASWSSYFNANMDDEWTVFLSGEFMSLVSRPAMLPYLEELSAQAAPAPGDTALTELSAGGQEYLSAATKIPAMGLTSMVIAPKNQLLVRLNRTLRPYWLVLLGCCGGAILISCAISGAITSPIRRMIDHINQIARENQEAPMPTVPMYSDFNALADAFNHMLKQLNASYKDNMEKQLLLKNSEIRSLQSQMDPHFLFNTLNTIAWNAQMSGNEEVYQMVIALGELLKTNTIAKESSYATLGDELRYVQLYSYLQKMRFEDKISVELQVAPELYGCRIPRFCIQPLVENAFVHGLEPKKGNGKLAVNVILQENQLEINVLDNGIGFQEIPDIEQIAPDSGGAHTHIGLHNLDRRLRLLFGESARLHISNVPYVCTTISFHVPLNITTEEEKL